MQKSKKYMIKLSIVLFIIGTVASGHVWAVPAAPGEHVLTQPDGSTFTARQWGDEWLHGWENSDGYAIMEHPDNGNWVYAVIGPDGNLAPSEAVAGSGPAPASVIRHVRPSQESSSSALRGRRAPSAIKPVVPPTGIANIPIILINFNNRTTSYSTADFENLLFTPGTKSMRDYYEEVSYGQFSVSSGPSGILGWAVASRGHAYYGGNNVNGRDSHPAELVIEAVKQADPYMDYSQYDLDGDCFVDAIAIIHQGTGEETGASANDIWSHRWNLNSAQYYGDGTGIYTTADTSTCGRIKVNDYLIQPETVDGQMSTIGVITHEYGHALDLPDLYDTDSSSRGIGRWGLMAGGSWNKTARAGDTPAHMSAWSKAFLGWAIPTRVTGTLTSESILSAASHPDVYKLIPGNFVSSNEYFLIENRQQTGFDSALPGNGLAIWHIDESKDFGNKNNTEECYPPMNCTFNHYHVALVQADARWDLEKSYNSGDSGDLFSASHRSSFAFNSAPDSKKYNSMPSGIIITSISNSGATMTAGLSIERNSPVADIKGNYLKSATINSYNNLAVTIALDAAGEAGHNCDWWLVADTPSGWYYYDANSSNWAQGFAVSYQGAISDVPTITVLNTSGLPAGSYDFYFGVDRMRNGTLDMDNIQYDSMKVNIH